MACEDAANPTSRPTCPYTQHTTATHMQCTLSIICSCGMVTNKVQIRDVPGMPCTNLRGPRAHKECIALPLNPKSQVARLRFELCWHIVHDIACTLACATGHFPSLTSQMETVSVVLLVLWCMMIIGLQYTDGNGKHKENKLLGSIPRAVRHRSMQVLTDMAAQQLREK